MSRDLPAASNITQLIDIVFPGDTNHHGTMFGGFGLAHMDKVAFIAASRHGRVDFVTASCERIDFKQPALMGDMIELTGHVTRVGTRSLDVEVDLVAEAPLTGERRLCGRGVFHMVAVGSEPRKPGWSLPPVVIEPRRSPDRLRMVELVFPGQTSHYGSLYGGNALAAMAKAAFVTATRHCRKTVVLAVTERVDFKSQVHNGEVIELIPQVDKIGRTSMTIEVDLWAENLKSGERRASGHGSFVMVAVNAQGMPVTM